MARAASLSGVGAGSATGAAAGNAARGGGKPNQAPPPLQHHAARAHLKNDAVARSRRGGGTPYAAEPHRGARPQRRGRRTCGTSTEGARTYAARRLAAATAAGGIFEMRSSIKPMVR